MLTVSMNMGSETALGPGLNPPYGGGVPGGCMEREPISPFVFQSSSSFPVRFVN
jgi:hypothetical protein